MRIEPGQVLGGKYRIVRLLGEGGMGAVFEGENAFIHRRVAIKVLHTQVSADDETVKRFEWEAQAAGRIGSKHIVEVLDLGEFPDGTRYMVLEFLEGCTLADRIKARGRLTPGEATPIMLQLLEGLAAAHQAQIIHRDLKPANVFLLSNARGAKDFVKILDFGVSKFNVLGGGDDSMSMTKTGAVMGTPFYMSPEQAKGERAIDHRSDLYTVGVILYECLTGQVPFHAETFNELMFKIVLDSPRPPETFVPDLDPHAGAIIRKAMAREPSDRYQSASEFQQAVRGRPASLAPPPPAGPTAAAVRKMPTPSRGVPAFQEPISIPKRSSVGLVVGASVLGLALVGGAAFAAVRWRAAQAEAAVSSASVAAPSPSPPADVSAPPDAPAAASSAGATSPAASSPTVASPAVPRPRTTAPPRDTGRSSPVAPEPPTPPPPPPPKPKPTATTKGRAVSNEL